MLEFITYLEPGSRVLDLGCGSGRDSRYLADHGFDVYGVDISEVAIEKAKRIANSHDISFSVGTAENLPFQDGHFDAVYAGWVLQSVPLHAGASEVTRVLRRNGIAFLAFLLNTKFVENGHDLLYHGSDEILRAYRDFRVLDQRRYVSEELETDKPHIHDAFILVLRK